MIQRCYSEKYKEKHPTYLDCTVTKEWHSFMNFKKWMEKQDWIGKQLDKDILFKNNKRYDSEKCVFVSSEVNSFIIERENGRGEYPLGVSIDSKKVNSVNKFKATIGISGKSKHVGSFKTAESAHQAWLTAKHELAVVLSEKQTDERVAHALRTRYNQTTTEQHGDGNETQRNAHLDTAIL